MARKCRSHGQGTLFKRNGRGPWITSWYDHAGKRRERSSRTTDKAAAERILAKHVADAALRREGVIDPKADQYARADRRMLSDHLIDFRADLIAKGNTHKHSNETYTLALRVAELGVIERIGGLTPSRVQAAVKAIRDTGRSLRTCNKALRAIKSFSRWLVRDHRFPSDALAYMKSYNADTDRKLERRALSDDELTRLFDVAEHGPTVRAMTGADRAMAYRLAAGTGFRVSELRSLKPTCFDLDVQPPTVTVAAGYSKRRRQDVQPIRTDLAELLRPWLTNKRQDESVLPLPKLTAEMIRFDLSAAGIPCHDASGRVVDFHALRHTYISRLVSSGASVKIAQELARHSTPTLTIGRYAHTRLYDLSAALDGLPATENPGDEAVDLKATGTDYAPFDPQLYPQQSGRETEQRDATSRIPGTKYEMGGRHNDKTPKPLRPAALSDHARHDASKNKSAGERTRTFTRGEPERILNPPRLPIPPHRLFVTSRRAGPHTATLINYSCGEFTARWGRSPSRQFCRSISIW